MYFFYNILIQGFRNINEFFYPSIINEEHLVAYLHHQNTLYSRIFDEFITLLMQAPAK